MRLNSLYDFLDTSVLLDWIFLCEFFVVKNLRDLVVDLQSLFESFSIKKIILAEACFLAVANELIENLEVT